MMLKTHLMHLNVIAKVVGIGENKGQFNEAKAWWHDDEKVPFQEMMLTVFLRILT